MSLKISRPQIFFLENQSYERDELDEWFNENVEPINKILSELDSACKKVGIENLASLAKGVRQGVEVSGESRERTDGLWNMHETVVGEALPNHTHKALLINIEPIKQETPQEFFQWILDNAEKAKQNLEMDSFINECNRRCRALLEKK